MSDDEKPTNPLPFSAPPLPAGVEMVYQVMVPIQVNVGCEECKVVLQALPSASMLLGPNQQPGPTTYKCPQCGKVSTAPAQFPTMGFTPMTQPSNQFPELAGYEVDPGNAGQGEGDEQE